MEGLLIIIIIIIITMIVIAVTNQEPEGTVIGPVDAGPADGGFELTADLTCEQAQATVASLNQLLTDAIADRDRKQSALNTATTKANNAKIAAGIAAAAVIVAAFFGPISFGIAVAASTAATGYLLWCNQQRSNALLELNQANNNVTLLEQQLSVAEALRDLACSSKKDTPVHLFPTGTILVPPPGKTVPPISRKESCRVKIILGKVTCVGSCSVSRKCILFGRKKGSKGKWLQQSDGVKYDPAFEYCCFCDG